MSTLLMINLNLLSKHKNLYRLNKCVFSSYTPPIRPSKSFRETKYLAKDNIPDGFRIIYRAPMEYYLSACKNITTITSTLVTLLAGYRFATRADFLELGRDVDLRFDVLQTNESDLIFFAIGFILFTIVLRVLISKYPLRIYKNNTDYIGIFEGQLPFKNKRIEFQKGDVIEYYGMIFNPWRDSMYKANNHSFLLLIDGFKTPSELYQMLK